MHTSPIKTSRLLLALILLAAFTLPTPAATPAAAPKWTRDDAAHLLRRAGFSGTPQQIDRLFAYGQSAAVDYFIDGKIPEGQQPVFAPAVLNNYDLSSMSEGKAAAKARGPELQSLRAWWIDRMARSDRPLEEKMTLFWHGLFCSGVKETKSPLLMATQNALFHKEAMGNYRRLTHEIVHDPAMLRYLNANENTKTKPNENLARELMELFTMGEGNGYTEKDIGEIAKALTGATGGPNGYAFRPALHDTEAKTIFGHTGNYKPDDVVNLIFDTGNPAKYLARRLWLFFGSPEPADADLAPIVDAIQKNDWDLKPTLRALFNSPAFYAEKARFAIVRSPAELVVSTMRSVDVTPSQPMLFGAANALNQMSQALFQPPNVRGWPGGEQWITSATLYTRYNTMQSILEGTIRGNARPPGAKNGKKPAEPTTTVPAEAADAAPVTQIEPVVIAQSDAGSAINIKSETKQDQAKARRLARKNAAGPATAPTTSLPALARSSGPVSVAKLFPALPATPTAPPTVDAAVSRFLQRPFPEKKRQVLIDALGNDPIKIGQETSDGHIRQMIELLMSTPEYQLE